MVFPFTFSFSVPGLSNPFGSGDATPGSSKPPVIESMNGTSGAPRPSATLRSRPPVPGLAKPPLRRIDHHKRRFEHSPSPSPSPTPTSRKRGWEPSDPTPSQSTTDLTTSSGYLDTPARYRELLRSKPRRGPSDEQESQEVVMVPPPEDLDMPPLKRRRGLAGSIISTAISAALIGSAVGLTVYRLWRDRGKVTYEEAISSASIEEQPHSEEAVDHETTQDRSVCHTPPPPPYHAGGWTTVSHPPASTKSPAAPRSVRRTPGGGNRSLRKRPVRSTASRPAVGLGIPHVQPQPDFSSSSTSRQQSQHQHYASASTSTGISRREDAMDDGEDEVADKMDWIGDKLAMLIEQGKRALNTEVVVMSEAKEDEVDDGSGAWDDEDDEFSDRRGLRRRGSARRVPMKKPKNIQVPSVPVPMPSTSPKRVLGGFAPGSAPSTSTAFSHHQYNPSPARNQLYSSSEYSASTSNLSTPAHSSRNTHHRIHSYESSFSLRDEDACASPELQESMRRARERILAARGSSSSAAGWS